MREQNYDIKNIAEQFAFEGTFIEARPFGSGHINDTFVAHYKKSDDMMHRYILQRINHEVFKKPEEMMHNIAHITNHLKNKIVGNGGDSYRETLNLIFTREGKNFHKCPQENYWRAFVFIEGAKTYEVVADKKHMHSAGCAVGQFHRMLKDFHIQTLHETIEDFHNTQKRYDDFISAVDADDVGRVAHVKDEINFATTRSTDASIISNSIESGDIPISVAHNDTKFNNIMIDNTTGAGLCLIDLDTVMPGSVLFDFGDAIRSGTNTAHECEKDLTKVSFDIGLFEQFTKGFFENAQGTLSPVEIDLLAFSARLITLETGVRFLTDYIQGDIYFKINCNTHNLDRARVQFEMVAQMEKQSQSMQEIVCKYAR
ncbi:MAG: aminoglycoside phosphotransferase family protein [Clostridiales bacterium]|nr:aminoglycoside phosphotransferase family protein [Clostridiales bacterium]